MSTQDEIAAENERLSAQVKRLIRAESRLYSFQEELEKKRSLFKKIAAVGIQLSAKLDRTSVMRATIDCIVIELCFERCLLVEHDGTGFRVTCHEGYYEPAEAAALVVRPLPLGPALLTALAASSGPLVAARGEPVAPPLAAELAELGAAARLDRFFVFSLDQGTRERPGGPAVVMLIGGTEARARYHAAVGRDSELLPMLSILLTQAAAALRNAQLYQELLDERNSLDDKVKARTGELSQANQDLTVALLKTRESERVKMEFLANVSHELRTPLNSIINLPDGLLLDFPRVPAVTCACCQASFALEPGEVVAGTDSCPTCGAVAGFVAVETVVYQGEPAQTRQYLETVVRCGRHLLSVVNDILDASRLEAGRVELHEERVELATVVDDVSRAVGALAAQRGLQLVLPTLDASQTLFGDRVRLAQILINLLGNAIKFSHPGGRVTLQVECPEDAVRFVIADQGIGIAVADQERIFESFRQVDGGHTRRFGGSGLGLAITRQLVLLHQGRVWLRSQLGEGSTFFVELPRRPGPGTAVSGAPGGSS